MEMYDYKINICKMKKYDKSLFNFKIIILNAYCMDIYEFKVKHLIKY